MNIIAGKFKGKKILTPKNIRPATAIVRDAIFNISQNILEDASFLDIFSGSGALGLEALSRGAKKTTFIDNSYKSIQIIKKNIKNLKLEDQTIVIQKDALKAIKTLNQTFDIISIDPPFILYKQIPSYINDLISALQTQNLITANSVIFLEEPTYSKREFQIEGFHLLNKRKYGSCHLLQYALR